MSSTKQRGSTGRTLLHVALWIYVVIGIIICLGVGFGGYFSTCSPGGWFCFAGNPVIFLIGLVAGVFWPLALLMAALAFFGGTA